MTDLKELTEAVSYIDQIIIGNRRSKAEVKHLRVLLETIKYLTEDQRTKDENTGTD